MIPEWVIWALAIHPFVGTGRAGGAEGAEPLRKLPAPWACDGVGGKLAYKEGMGQRSRSVGWRCVRASLHALPLTLGRTLWCTQYRPLSWSGRTESVSAWEAPRLEGRKRADQSYSAWSPDPNLLLGSGLTGKNWSPNAWEGGWQQSPGVHPPPTRDSPWRTVRAPQCVSIVSLRRAPNRAGMAAPWGGPTRIVFEPPAPRKISAGSHGLSLSGEGTGLTRISSPSLVSSLVHEVLGPSPFKSLCSQTILFSLSHFTRLCKRGMATCAGPTAGTVQREGWEVPPLYVPPLPGDFLPWKWRVDGVQEKTQSGMLIGGDNRRHVPGASPCRVCHPQSAPRILLRS